MLKYNEGTFSVSSWVSNLGPVLANLFIKKVDANIMSFQLADDTRVGGVVNDEDISLLQSDLNGLLKWVRFWTF